MKFLWVFSIKEIKQFLLVATAFIITFVIIYNEKDNISVFINSKETNAIYSVETNKKQIALTFDISWGDVRQDPILDILEENGLMGKVTFFLSSPWGQEHPETINRIVQGGYEIGNHGDRYVNYTELEAEDIKNEIVKAGNIIYNLTGQRPNLIRTPNGDIILMHASDSSKQTHEALPIIIERLKKEGYTFLTVSQLISDSKINLSEIK